MSLPRRPARRSGGRESIIADFLDSGFRGNDAKGCPLGLLGVANESCESKMGIECKGSAYFVSSHQHEGNAIRKAYLMFGKLLKVLQCPYFVFLRWAQDGHVMGRIDLACSFGCKWIACPTGQQGKSFMQDKVACEARLLFAPNFIPECYRCFMILVTGEIARKQCPCVNEYQLSPP